MSENKDKNCIEPENTAKDMLALFECIDVVNMQLREPVTGIFASLPLLAENINRQDTEKAMETLVSIYGASYRLLKGINNMSTGARLAQGKVFAKEAIDFSSFVKSIFQSAEMVLTSGYSHTLDIEAGIVVNASKTLLTSALFNLIANSLDYRTQKDVHVSVSLKSKGDRCTLVYRDNSIGIKEELSQQVFQPFFSRNPYNDGEISEKMGMGLYIVQQAVLQAGGTVLLQTEFDKGVNIVISVPQCSDCSNAVKSMAKDFVLNRYSDVFVQLCEHCNLPDMI